MSARTVIELHAHSGIESHLFRITVDGEERAARLDAVDAERQLARITERMRSREGPLSVIRHAKTGTASLPTASPCTWVPPECMALFDADERETGDNAEDWSDGGSEVDDDADVPPAEGDQRRFR